MNNWWNNTSYMPFVYNDSSNDLIRGSILIFEGEAIPLNSFGLARDLHPSNIQDSSFLNELMFEASTWLCLDLLDLHLGSFAWLISSPSWSSSWLRPSLGLMCVGLVDLHSGSFAWLISSASWSSTRLWLSLSLRTLILNPLQPSSSLAWLTFNLSVGSSHPQQSISAALVHTRIAFWDFWP